MPKPLDFSWVTNPFLKTYLSYVEHTESPRLMHLFSALACSSACMGRHTYLDTGIGKLYGNLYVLLVGPPGTRKSSAINFSRKLIQSATSVKFAPKDTSGKKQGLITAMTGDHDGETNDIFSAMQGSAGLSQINTLGSMDFTLHPEDKHSLFVCASEFGSFVGQNNLELIRFLVEMWDGEDYPYQLKNTAAYLRDPLLSLVGGTTAADMATLLPPEAIGQGFMSRIVLVFAPAKDKIVPPSKAKINQALKPKLKAAFKWIEKELVGAMTMTPEATRYSDALYMRSPVINDSRFIFYSERRHTHLLKITMNLTALRQCRTIEKSDLEQADILLSAVEEYMPDALGEFGLSPLSLSKQKIVEFIRHAKEPVTQQILWIVMQRDMKLIDFKNCLIDLANAKKVIEVQTNYGPGYIYNDPIFEAVELLTELTEEENEEELALAQEAAAPHLKASSDTRLKASDLTALLSTRIWE